MPFIDNPKHKLDFDGLDLTGRTVYGEAPYTYTFEALADGATFGDPQPVVTEVESPLLNGSLLRLQRWGNREPSFQIWICAENDRGLALGERDLAARVGDTRRVLGWEPPDEWGARTEYDVQLSSLSHQFDDLNELMLVRAYTLRMNAAPFGYAEYEVETEAIVPPPETPTTVVVSDGTSAANWTNVTVDEGELKFSEVENMGDGTWQAVATHTLPSAVDFRNDTPYVSFTVRVNKGTSVTALAAADGTPFELRSTEPTAANEWRVSVAVPTRSAEQFESVSTLRFTVIVRSTSLPQVWLDDVQRTNLGTPTPTTKRTLQVTSPGSAPAVGSVEVAVNAAGLALGDVLGDVLLYTSSELSLSGYTPDVSRWLTTGTPGSTAWTAQIPVSALPPGTYQVLGGFSSGVGAVIPGAVITTKIGTDAISESVTMADADWSDMLVPGVVTLGTIELPQADVPRDGGAVVEIQVTHALLTEVWLFWKGEDAALTHVRCGDRTRLWLDDPALSDLTRGVFVGDEEDRSDARYPQRELWQTLIGVDPLPSWEPHRLGPQTLVHVATTGTTNATVTFRHRPAFHHFATHEDG